jgi:hypothetical protein
MTEQQRDAIATARDMTRALSAQTEQIEALRKELETERKERKRYGWHNRVIGGVALVLAVGLGFALWGVHRNGATISDVHDSSVSACQGGNQTRAQQIALWQYIYSVGVTKNTPPKARAEDNALIVHVKHVFAAKDCTAIYSIGGK